MARRPKIQATIPGRRIGTSLWVISMLVVAGLGAAYYAPLISGIRAPERVQDKSVLASIFSRLDSLFATAARSVSGGPTDVSAGREATTPHRVGSTPQPPARAVATNPGIERSDRPSDESTAAGGLRPDTILAPRVVTTRTIKVPPRQLRSVPVHAMDGQDLRIEILGRPGGGLTLVVGGAYGSRSVEVDADTAERLAAVRYTLECAVDNDCERQTIDAIEGDRNVLDDEALTRILSEGGEKLLAPFANEIRRASRLRIQLPPELIKITLDALNFDGRPLYTLKPIVYTVGRDLTPAMVPLSSLSVGLLISDHSADPDRAALAVADLFPMSASFDAGEVNPDMLPYLPRLDFALISAHGWAGYGGVDRIVLPNRNVLSADLIAALRPRIVYFDSCNLGISVSYLEKLQSAGVKYVLAPILSNEAGNSSTLTIETFFRELAAGSDPVTALHLARKKAFATFGREGRVTQFWRAFPFRIYALN